MHANIPDSQATADAITEALRPFHELVADGRRLRALNRDRWVCDAGCWDDNVSASDLEEDVAEAMDMLDGSNEAMDRLRAAIDRMIAADTPDPRQDDLFAAESQS